MNVLVCVDHSEESKKALRFAGQLVAGAGSGNSVTLCHVSESLPAYLLSDEPQPGLTLRSAARQIAAQADAEGQKLLAAQKDVLTAAGVAAGSIKTKLIQTAASPEAKQVAAAAAIIDEMKSGGYHVVCLGRRGASQLSPTFVGGVAEKVLRAAQGQTVCVVD